MRLLCFASVALLVFAIAAGEMVAESLFSVHSLYSLSHEVRITNCSAQIWMPALFRFRLSQVECKFGNELQLQ